MLNTKDGGTIDTPGGVQMTFPPETPKKFAKWIDQSEIRQVD